MFKVPPEQLIKLQFNQSGSGFQPFRYFKVLPGNSDGQKCCERLFMTRWYKTQQHFSTPNGFLHLNHSLRLESPYCTDGLDTLTACQNVKY